MDKEVIIDLIVKRVQAGEKLRMVLADFNIENEELGLFKCFICNQVISPIHDDFIVDDAHSHLYCHAALI